MNPRTSDVATEATWDFADNEEIVAAIQGATRKVVGWREGASEEDLLQDAMLYVAVRPELVANHPARIHHDVIRHLMAQDKKVVVIERAEHLDINDLDADMGLFNHGMEGDPFEGSGYPQPLIRQLLEAMWNGWVVVDEYRPDGDMPRAKPNPSKSGNDMAHRVDIERAWRYAPLSNTTRMALQLTLGRGLTEEAAGVGLDMTRHGVSYHVKQGLYLIGLQLNGVS